MDLEGMSNRMNPLLLRAAALVSLACLAASCSLVPWESPDEHPYRAAAESVVIQVGAHTPLSWRCRAAGAAIVEAGISVRLAQTGGELRHAALSSALAGLAWEKAECPASAVPGLSFGTADASKELLRGAHKTAGLR
jgi:hypothetical protein